MEDELEDRVFYQTYASHARLVSRASLPGLPSWGWNWGWTWTWTWSWSRLARLYLLRYEVILFSIAMIVLLMYIQAVEVWSRALLGRLGSGSRPTLQSSSDPGHKSWDEQSRFSAVYALQGRRPRMEDRFVIFEDVHDTGVAMFALFDGHGGEFAADYAKDKMVPLLAEKILAVKEIISGKRPADNPTSESNLKESKSFRENPLLVERKKSFKKTASTADDDTRKEITDPELLSKMSMSRTVTREVRPSPTTIKVAEAPLSSYIEGGKVNYGKLITDQVLSADRLLVEEAKKTMDVAGTTALIAILEDDLLTVANVGDSRGVMCDSKGNAIPLSFDHKPQQVRLLSLITYMSFVFILTFCFSVF